MLFAARGDESLSCGSNAAPQKALQLLRPKFDVRQTLSLSLLLAGEEELLFGIFQIHKREGKHRCSHKYCPPFLQKCADSFKEGRLDYTGIS